MKQMMVGIQIILVLSFLAFAGCAEVSEAPDMIKVGWIGPLSGDAASLGVPNLRGVQLAVKNINDDGGVNGKLIELVVEDDMLDYKESRNAFVKMVSVDDVDAILMAGYGGVLSAGPLADQHEVIMVSSVDTSDELGQVGPFTFGVGIYDEGIGYRLAEFLVNSKGIKTAAVMHLKEDPVLALFKDAFVQRFEELGGEVLVDEGYTSSGSDFRSTLLKIKESGAEALGVISYDEGGLVLNQAKTLGVEGLYFGIDTVTSEGFKSNAKDTMQGLYFTFWAGDSPEVERFTQQYVQRFGQEPENILFSTVGYDAMGVLAHAMESGATGDDLRKVLLSIEGYQGLAGEITMSPDGMVRTIQEGIFSYDDGELVLVEQ